MFHHPKNILRICIILLAAGLMFPNAQKAYGQAGIAVEESGAAVSFGRQITFYARIKSALPIQQATLLFRGVHEEFTRVETLQPAADGSVSYVYDASLNLIPPFTDVLYWFQVTLADNQVYTSQPFTFRYEDNRFPWKSINRANVTVYWYAGDDAFGARALEMAGAGMLAMREIIPLSLDDPIRIYIYANPADLQTTLALGGESWVAGHAAPQAGVALVAIAPEANQSEMQTKIPHELTHVMLYRLLREKYDDQPEWLIEGLASMMEQYPNPDYAYALETAGRNGSLIPFESLCDGFPRDSGGAFLAYAQSQSFMNYIRQTYGVSGISRLLNAYSDGLNCSLGATRALGTPLGQLDARWREEALGQNAMQVALRNLFPFMLILALVLIVPLWGLVDVLILRRRRRVAQPNSKP